MKKINLDLGYYGLGNGISVANKAKEVNGDYQKVAHIDDQGTITWYLDRVKVTDEDIYEIEKQSRIHRVNCKYGLNRGQAQNDQVQQSWSPEIKRAYEAELYAARLNHPAEIYAHRINPVKNDPS